MSKNKRSRKSSSWADRQNKDQFVKQARQQGLRARAAFKLEQIDQKYRLIKPGSNLIDLGAAPGSWCQYAVRKLTRKGLVLAIDLLEMPDIPGVDFTQGDFTEQSVQESLLLKLKNCKLDLVLSDMAPNITGIRVTDQARAEELQEAVYAFCLASLTSGGKLLTKIFEGESAKAVQKMYQQSFSQVQVIKPDASRAQSREIYILARDFHSI